jgi:hypothetical protein
MKRLGSSKCRYSPWQAVIYLAVQIFLPSLELKEKLAG